ncbi:MAG: type II toxin-antitoxin system YafQ family toxin [Acidobacteriota bacterium]
MLLELRTTTAFERDLRRVKKQGLDLDKLEQIVDMLQSQSPLPARCKPHPLRGTWVGHWDCHVGPDWILRYKGTSAHLILVRTGSHAELFGL